MTRRTARLRIAGAALLLALVAAAGLAQAQGVSEPAVAVPRPPATEGAELEIEDIGEAPPVAQESILALALLGAYPLDSGMRAMPNRLADYRTVAFMLVNVFAVRLVDQFPVPPDEALTFFGIVTGSVPPPDAGLTVADMRDHLLMFAQLAVDDLASLRMALEERYPALASGNPDTPLTRAGAALMIGIALEHLAGTRL